MLADNKYLPTINRTPVIVNVHESCALGASGTVNFLFFVKNIVELVSAFFWVNESHIITQVWSRVMVFVIYWEFEVYEMWLADDQK